ncbi:MULTISPECIES: tryptophan halogenase family protein [unclassified Duganella]|uniref:tryptophan halogenase family protein n=1 Tax=unclassified Duganella TaxID=2636909 RepID=UPI00087515E4|nr:MULTISPECIES: tryptophan halogenase family protein [unclassified Duganella]OEZ58561.1 flavin-dependent tryptophan halogenase PrnA [Duganella sp. HH105]OFA04493.1 flavin-dependent tryptophan halogenase PrnA [Duganella sp. HH101]
MSLGLVKNIVIVGGGTAGWMTAAAMSALISNGCKIRLVESDEISTIGVGEATIPVIRGFNQLIGVDENEFLRQTQGTFKLGIEFVNWSKQGESYIHGFGVIGRDQLLAKFYQYWLKLYQAGKAPGVEHYSINTMAASMNKFMRAASDSGDSPLSDISHAFHFDAGLYAKYLRGLSEGRGVRRTEGRIVDTVLRADDGFVEAIVMESGERIEGDLFVDCSGFRGLLIEGALKTGYEDWSHWLPCDRAIAVPCESVSPLLPYTRATAHDAGWQWRIPLQHRIGNGHVYSSKFMEPEQAESILMNNLDGKPLAQPRHLKFTTGKRKRAWNKNVVAIGLAGGFMEPLESTSIHLVQTGITRLLMMFPHLGYDQADIDSFNEATDNEYAAIRDFLILHYKLNAREGKPFWDYCRNMEIPATLQRRMDLYRSNGRIVRASDELFTETSWLQVMHGQGLRAKGYHPLVDQRSEADIAAFLANVKDVVLRCAEHMPTHEEYIASCCAAPKM